jgi:hypothetical protein
MSGHCRDCRWWQIPTRRVQRVTASRWDADAGRYVFDTKEHDVPDPTERPGWRVCRRADADGALMLLAGHDPAVLETAPDFGCVEFAPLLDSK